MFSLVCMCNSCVQIEYPYIQGKLHRSMIIIFLTFLLCFIITTVQLNVEHIRISVCYKFESREFSRSAGNPYKSFSSNLSQGQRVDVALLAKTKISMTTSINLGSVSTLNTIPGDIDTLQWK